jgi:HAD superfamily hydrolase (TIGR01549 family)
MMRHAVLFDLDGTLYRQAPLRTAMACEFALLPLRLGPRRAAAAIRVLRSFRHVREELRTADASSMALEDAQYSLTAGRTGIDEATVRRLVAEWIFTRPLRYLAASRRAGIVPAFRALRARGARIGVFSDYPTQAKLDALGLTPFVSLQICATDTSINAFKPHPRGFLAACEQWNLPPSSVTYVGDRPEVDAAGARSAGMSCLIVGSRWAADASQGYEPLRSFAQLETMLDRIVDPRSRAGLTAEARGT